MITNGFFHSMLACLSILSSGGLFLGLVLGIFGSKLAAECATRCFLQGYKLFSLFVFLTILVTLPILAGCARN